MSISLIKLLLITITLRTACGNYLKTARNAHRLQQSSDSDLRALSSSDDSKYVNKILDNILIPRVVGTENHEKVFKYLAKELRQLKWHVDVDEFDANVPIFGKLRFKNIVSTPNPSADRFLVLACHYDSKYFKKEVFVGAIDSAVPCAMMLAIAKALSTELASAPSVSLKLIFFDGEEAFENWGPKDSIYGAKHLAQQLHTNKTRRNGDVVSELDKIDVLILLDLIGAKNPVFLNYFEDTQKWFVRLAQIEYDLQRSGLLKPRQQSYFQFSQPYGNIEDDHVPFHKKGVPILHLITTPFPQEWHTSRDNRDIVDMNTVYNMNLILKAFVSEYLHLNNASTTEVKTEEGETPIVTDTIEIVNYVLYQPLELICIF